MWIKEIKINNFRNYNNEKIKLNKNINIFYVENAQGKTNIIEAIFLSSIGKSFRTSKDKELIKFGEKNCNVEINYEKSDRNGKIKINIENKKNIFINEIKIKKLSELLGNINIVIFTPDDINILKGGPQNRRKFLDVMISQLRPKYMYLYNMHLKTIEERNSFLKKSDKINYDLLDIYDEKLAEYGHQIYLYRKEFIEKIKNKIKNIHYNITGEKEKIEIKYISDCAEEEKYLDLLKEKRKMDLLKGYTSKGIHRDDLNIYLNNLLVNIYGSQGQHRTAILSLKLAELQVIYDEIGENPILLLDDFMSELDESRRVRFLENLKDTQVIITCTDKFDLENVDYTLFNVKNGEINKNFNKNI